MTLIVHQNKKRPPNFGGLSSKSNLMIHHGYSWRAWSEYNSQGKQGSVLDKTPFPIKQR